jgi:hypothetical protein
MKATKLAPEISSKVSLSFSVGQPVRICLGTLAGVFGTLAGLPAPGRTLIELQRGIYLEIDQSSLETESTE